jgi:hypothetical protein
MTDRYRVIQWATGNVGKAAIRHFIDNPVFELAGVFVTDSAKEGVDAGDIAGAPKAGVLATTDAETILALDADCVHYAPRALDLDMVCRLLESGKNVVSPLGFHYPTDYYAAQLERIEAACAKGGTSFHGTGIHPGFAGDLLPLTLAQLMSRIDCIHIREYADLSNKHEAWPRAFGFGGDPEEIRRRPGRSPESLHAFAQSMAMVVEGLGKTIEDVTAKFEVATATRDLAPPFGPVPAGSVAGMHFEWTAWADGRPVLVYHSFWTLGDQIDPPWDAGGNRYEVIMDGDPPLRMTLEANARHPGGDQGYWGLVWTAMSGVNSIPDVCKADPGLVTHLDLGLVLPSGLLR